jgi:hypothetical protein
MKKTISKLRERPQHQKDRIAFVGSVVITGIIVLFWLVGTAAMNSPQANQAANTTAPVESLQDSIGSLLERERN